MSDLKGREGARDGVGVKPVPATTGAAAASAAVREGAREGRGAGYGSRRAAEDEETLAAG